MPAFLVFERVDALRNECVPGRPQAQHGRIHSQQSLMTEDQGAFDQIFQLPDIAGPAVLNQAIHRLRLKISTATLEAPGMLAQEMPGEKRDILRTFAQGR